MMSRLRHSKDLQLESRFPFFVLKFTHHKKKPKFFQNMVLKTRPEASEHVKSRGGACVLGHMTLNMISLL